jgi:hypothetical protein
MGNQEWTIKNGQSRMDNQEWAIKNGQSSKLATLGTQDTVQRRVPIYTRSLMLTDSQTNLGMFTASSL